MTNRSWLLEAARITLASSGAKTAIEFLPKLGGSFKS
jgi:hypothetical protein